MTSMADKIEGNHTSIKKAKFNLEYSFRSNFRFTIKASDGIRDTDRSSKACRLKLDLD